MNKTLTAIALAAAVVASSVALADQTPINPIVSPNFESRLMESNLQIMKAECALSKSTESRQHFCKADAEEYKPEVLSREVANMATAIARLTQTQKNCQYLFAAAMAGVASDPYGFEKANCSGSLKVDDPMFAPMISYGLAVANVLSDKAITNIRNAK